MKKIIFVAIIWALFLTPKIYAFDTTLLDIRNEIFAESKEIKSLLSTSKDLIILNSMWDSCIIANNQLDAYFTMVAIFNAIDKDKLSKKVVGYLVVWLDKITKTNDLNIKSLDVSLGLVEAKTKVRIQRLKKYFAKLNKGIEKELDKISLITRSFPLRNSR